MSARLPRGLFSANQVRELDARAISEQGIPAATLMERAGRRAFSVSERLWPTAKRIYVVCGIGNNGGDGFVVARLARLAGLEPTIVCVGDQHRLAGHTAQMFEAARSVEVPAVDWSNKPAEAPDLFVDALLGTGINRDVSGVQAQAVAWMNDAPTPVLSIDIPSGLHADTGRVCGDAVHAACTVTFIGLKLGLVTGAARAHCGQLFFDSLGVSRALRDAMTPRAETICYGDLASHLRARSRIAHKGHFGHVLIVGGNAGLAGAARLSGEAAARSGAGLISVAVHPQSAAVVGVAQPEMMVRGVGEAADLTALLARASVIAIGPGLGVDSWSEAFFATVLAHATEHDLPTVIDADGLNRLAGAYHEGDVALPTQLILTPHPGEASRLLDTSVAEVEADRYRAALNLAERYSATVILKGAGTVIASEAGMFVCTHGNPGMGSGGMGDVLTGVIAGLLAQALSPTVAAPLGVCLHASAADTVAEVGGERGLLASDLFPEIRRLVNPA
ncbi:MAG: NAD(P)H-hydrate dehydratase [Pseudomonadota bacterium]